MFLFLNLLSTGRVPGPVRAKGFAKCFACAANQTTGCPFKDGGAGGGGGGGREGERERGRERERVLPVMLDSGQTASDGGRRERQNFSQ